MDSTTSGLLAPTSGLVPYDDDLLDLLQPIIVGIGGWTDPKLVRPRWQVTVPNRPEYSVNWCAFGIARSRKDTFNHETELDSAEGGYTLMQHSEEIDLLISNYGPKSKGIAEMMSDGFQLAQNRDQLLALEYPMDLLSVSDAVLLPSLVSDVWAKRCDFTVTLRRIVRRTYAVRSIAEIDTNNSFIDQEAYRTPIMNNP